MKRAGIPGQRYDLTPRQWLLTAVLALLGAAAWWLRPVGGPPPVEGAAERRPDYTVERLVATQMDPTGKPKHRLIAEEVKHFPQDDSTELTAPRLTVFNPETPPWQVRANNGWVSTNGEQVVLRGDVHLDREAFATTRAFHLTTEELRVTPAKDYAETDRFARMTSGEDWLTSDRGGRAWLGESLRLELDGRVKGLFTRSILATPEGPVAAPGSTPRTETP